MLQPVFSHHGCKTRCSFIIGMSGAHADIGCSCKLSEDQEFRSSQPQSNPISKARQCLQMHQLIYLCKIWGFFSELSLQKNHKCGFKKSGHWFLSNIWFWEDTWFFLDLTDWLPFYPQVKRSQQCGNVKTYPGIPFWVTYSPVGTTQFWRGSLQSWECEKTLLNNFP